MGSKQTITGFKPWKNHIKPAIDELQAKCITKAVSLSDKIKVTVKQNKLELDIDESLNITVDGNTIIRDEGLIYIKGFYEAGDVYAPIKQNGVITWVQAAFPDDISIRNIAGTATLPEGWADLDENGDPIPRALVYDAAEGGFVWSTDFGGGDLDVWGTESLYKGVFLREWEYSDTSEDFSIVAVGSESGPPYAEPPYQDGDVILHATWDYARGV